MRSILALGLLVALSGAANAATMRHAHRTHTYRGAYASDPASGFAYAPGPGMSYRAAPYEYYGPYSGASQGYAPGEREQFLNSVRQGG